MTSNWCRRRYWKFRVDICCRFLAIEKIREGGNIYPSSAARVKIQRRVSQNKLGDEMQAAQSTIRHPNLNKWAFLPIFYPLPSPSWGRGLQPLPSRTYKAQGLCSKSSTWSKHYHITLYPIHPLIALGRVPNKVGSKTVWDSFYYSSIN